MYEELFIQLCNENNLYEAKKLYNNDLDINFDELFLSMCKKGNLIIIEWLIELNENNNLILEINNIESNEDSIYQIESPYESNSIHTSIYTIKYLSFRIACIQGHLEVVKIIYNLYIIHNIHNEWINIIFNECCNFGQFHIILWLYSNFHIDLEYENDESITPFANVCLNGHLEIAQWLYSIDQNVLNINTFYSNEYNINNDLKLCKNYSDNFVLSCESGNLKIPQWLLKISPNINIHRFNDYAFYRVCNLGHIEVAQWLYNIDKNIDFKYNEEFTNKNENFFSLVCSNGYLNLAIWIFSIDNDIINDLDITLIFQKSCKDGYLELSKWLLETFNSINLSNINNIFFLTAINGHIEILQWLYNLNIEINVSKSHLIFNVCLNGYLNIAQWLYEINNNILNIEIISVNILIKKLCSKGNLEIIKWLYEKKSISYDILDTCFYEACINDHFETAKWLKNIENNNIIVYEKLFILVCQNCSIEIAQWLYNINPLLNLRYNNDEAIKFAYNKCNYSIVMWLSTLLPEVYEFEMKRGKVIKYFIILNLLVEKEKKCVEKNEECSICKLKLSDIITNCNHQYCYICLNEWYNKSNDFNCPLCRIYIEKIYNIEK